MPYGFITLHCMGNGIVLVQINFSLNRNLLSLLTFISTHFQVIKRIYELAWVQFSDLPRGHHKNNSMHKLASKTMIEILPESLIQYVEEKCGSLASTPDFFDVIGQVSWYDDVKA